MKLIISLRTLVGCAFAAALLTACRTNDRCRGMMCPTGNICDKDDGICHPCPSGYEGVDCKTESRTRLLGTWNARDEERPNSYQKCAYKPEILQGSAINEVIIQKFSGVATGLVKAFVTDTTFTIPEQDPGGDGFRYVGSGHYSKKDGRLYLIYTFKYPPDRNLEWTYDCMWFK